MKIMNWFSVVAVSVVLFAGCDDCHDCHAKKTVKRSIEPSKTVEQLDFSREAKPFVPYTVQEGDVLFNLASQANFDYNDRVEGDKLDGWSCRAHDNDQRNFAMNREKLYAGVPFDTVNTDFEDARTCIGFKAATYQKGICCAEFAAPAEAISGPAYLYLLHSYVAGDKVADGIVAGKIKVTGKDGSVKIVEVITGRDVQVQRREFFGDDLANAKLATWWRSTHSQLNCFCTSKFDLGMPVADIAKIELLASEAADAPAWMVAGVTLSNRNIELLSIRGNMTITANDQWKQMTKPEDSCIIAGSALDMRPFNKLRPVDETGRVIINPDGHFAFESAPDVPVHFFSAVSGACIFFGQKDRFNDYPPQINTKEGAERRVEDLCRNGYNMERLHCMDSALIVGATEPGEYGAQLLDQFDYYVYCMKQKGLYLNSDCAVDPSMSDITHQFTDCKSRIHFDPKARELWLKGVRNLFGHVNPYTGMRLVDDPVLVALIGYNEQEYAFEDAYDAELGKPFFQKFLAEKYNNDIAALNTAWAGTEGAGDYTDFGQIPFFTDDAPRSNSAYGKDVARFIQHVENNTQEFFIKELRDLGFKGTYCNFNVGKNLHYNVSHTYGDAVQANTYHAHPSKWIFAGSAVNQDGTAAGADDLFRWTIIAKQERKPLISSEYQICFWQKHRYELPFSMGAYCAFQDMDGLTSFAENNVLVPDWRIRPFLNANDPIHRADEFLNFFLFGRRDVQPATGKLRLLIDPEAVYNEGRAADSISPVLTRFALVTGFASDVVHPVRKHKSCDGKHNEKDAKSCPRMSKGGSHHRGWSKGFSATFALTSCAHDSHRWPYVLPDKAKLDPDKMLAYLKEEFVVPEENRTSFADEIYESETGELYLDCKKELYAVNTPKFQGIAAPENTPWQLTDVNILANSTRGALAVVAIDGEEPIKTAKRLLVTYTTNCYNDGTVFGDSRMFEMQKICASNILLGEVGKFTVQIDNAAAANMKAYALGLNGARLQEVPLTVTADGKLELTVDTGTLTCGPVVFFELIAE